LNHGITIAALFLVAGWLQERIGSTTIGPIRGVAHFLPLLCWLTLFFVMSNVALPGLNNFVGEVMILFGLFGQNPWLTAVLGLSVILSVMYMLRWMQKVYFEEPTFHQEAWIDIKGRELAIALPLAAIITWLGIYPAPVLEHTETAVSKFHVVNQSEGIQ
jgi:NADH-quinone oxidoreductase subunit M